MFQSEDHPAIVNDNNTVPTEPNNTTKPDQKCIISKKITSLQRGIEFRIVMILLIISISIFIGLLSVFIPKQNNATAVSPTAESVTLTLILPITQNTSYVLSLSNSSLIVGNYFSSAQRNILKSCLQTQLKTQLITILSIDDAQAQYSGNNNNQTKRRRILRRIRRQITSLANQVEFTVSIQCSTVISETDCRQLIELVLDNGIPLKCTSTDEMGTSLSPSPSTITTTTKLVVAQVQNWRQVGELFLAFGLTALVGLERELRGKNAGLRTHCIVGTTSALIMQVSKYGFSDVLYTGMVVLDPSRIAAQIVSGISFLGAGIIIAHRTTIHGLTTSASVWSASTIGMTAGCGLWVLSLASTGLHFLILLGFLPLEEKLPFYDKHARVHRKVDDDYRNESDDQYP